MTHMAMCSYSMSNLGKFLEHYLHLKSTTPLPLVMVVPSNHNSWWVHHYLPR